MISRPIHFSKDMGHLWLSSWHEQCFCWYCSCYSERVPCICLAFALHLPCICLAFALHLPCMATLRALPDLIVSMLLPSDRQPKPLRRRAPFERNPYHRGHLVPQHQSDLRPPCATLAAGQGGAIRRGRHGRIDVQLGW